MQMNHAIYIHTKLYQGGFVDRCVDLGNDRNQRSVHLMHHGLQLKRVPYDDELLCI